MSRPVREREVQLNLLKHKILFLFFRNYLVFTKVTTIDIECIKLSIGIDGITKLSWSTFIVYVIWETVDMI